MNNKRKQRRKAGWFGKITTCISTTLVLLFLGIMVLTMTMATNYSRQVREELTVALTLSDSVKNAQLIKTQNSLRQAPYTRLVDYVSKERGTREMNEALQSDIIGFVGSSPIPAEFEVYLKADYANIDSLEHYKASMLAMPGVIDVNYPKDIIVMLDRTIPSIGFILLGVVTLMTLISFSLINNSIRMHVYAQRYNIQTMKLVGASWWFIRRPFISQALGIGLVAALIASSIIAGSLYYMQFEAGGGDIYFNELITPWVWILTLSTIFLCGTLLSIWCAYISVNHHLRMKSNQIYLK